MNKESKTTKIKEFIFSSWAIEHRTVIYVIMSIFFILGISSYFSMPREAFPEINDTKVFVSTIYPGNTAEDIEIFNKKAIYLYLREITGMNTKQVVTQLNKMRKRYREFRNDWDDGKI